jgi:hypothetical protein
MSLRNILTRLFRPLRRRAELSQRECLHADLSRRERAQKRNPIDFACRGNRLTERDRARLLAFYDEVEALHGPHDALQQTRNLAASIAKRRDARLQRAEDPWQPTPPAAAA